MCKTMKSMLLPATTLNGPGKPLPELRPEHAHPADFQAIEATFPPDKVMK